MTIEKMNESIIPSYDDLIEEEEETITLDFNNKTIYQKEEHLIVKTSNSDGIISHDPGTGITIADCLYRRPTIDTFVPDAKDMETQEKNAFQAELNNLLVDTITSKALASLLTKQRAVADKVEKTIQSKRLGELTELMDTEVYKVMDKRRQEIRSCFIGGEVRYELIPSWARSYVKEYMKDMIHGLATLTEDGE